MYAVIGKILCKYRSLLTSVWISLLIHLLLFPLDFWRTSCLICWPAQCAWNLQLKSGSLSPFHLLVSLQIFHLTTHPSPFNESPNSLIGCNPICYILHNLTPPSLLPPKLFSSQVCSDFCRIWLLFKFCDGSAKFLWSVSVSPQVKQSFANFTALLTSTPPLIIPSRVGGRKRRKGGGWRHFLGSFSIFLNPSFF